jgi:hypothetical protein
MKTCIVALLAMGGIWSGAIGAARAQSPPAPATKPAPIIITNSPANGKAARLYLTAGVQEILKMHEAGVDKSVILAFVQSSSVAYHPSAREVIYLRDEGVSPEIISAMLRRGGDLRDRAAELQREELRTRQVEQPPPAAPAPAEPAQPQSSTVVVPQATQVVYASAPAYSYPVRNYISFPSYGYGYVRPSWYGYSYANCRPYYWPSFSLGFRSSCYPRYGLSVGFGGYRGGWSHGGVGWRHCL